MTTPLYLADPATTGHTYGTLSRRGNHYELHAEPVVLEMAKRLFPGCNVNVSGMVTFSATTRAVGDLNWLMLRYPLQVKHPEQFSQDRERAIAHALRREANQTPTPQEIPPTFRGELRPYQQEGVNFLIANERTLLADDMGLGKTITALAALAAAEAFPVLLVVMTNIQRQWVRQAGTFLDLPIPGQQEFDLSPIERGERMCHIIRGLKPYQLPKRPLYVMHYGLLRGWRYVLPELGVRAVVYDEIQELRHTGTDKYSVASLVAGSAQYVWGLSGTPVYNYGDEIWSILNILEFNCLGSREAFTREWCVGYGAREVAKPDVLGDHLRREGLMLRRRKSDVQGQLPPKRRVVHVVDSDQTKYNALITEAVRLAERYDSITSWTERGQTKRQIEGAARMAAGVAKAPYVAAFVRSLLEAGERVLLYAYHHAVHDLLADELTEFKPVRITGEQSAKEKEAAVATFAQGDTNLIQLSLRSTAGLDQLQGRGSVVVFAELDWSPAIHSQCEDRLHRIGIDPSLESVLCYYLVSDTGMDETKQEALGLKVGQFVGLMGDRVATEEDRVLADQAAERHLDRVIQRLRQHGKEEAG